MDKIFQMIMIIEDIPTRTELAKFYSIQNIKNVDFNKLNK